MSDVTLNLTPCGPIDRIQAKLGLAHPGGKKLVMRAALIGLIAWLPLAVMTLVMPRAEDVTSVSFFRDVAAHIRFLIVIPLLIVIETSIGSRTLMVVANLATSGIVSEDDLPRLRTAAKRADRWADSFWVEALLLVGTFASVYFMSRGLVADNAQFWYEEAAAGGMRLTWPGRWYMFVSSPIVAFLFVRWSWRYIVWSRFLQRTSRLNLRLSRTHPDCAGGLAFINVGHTAFAAVGFAASCVVAAAGANRILYEGAHIRDYQSVIIGFIVASVAIGLAPLFTFLVPLLKAKRIGLVEYGRLGNRYVQAFEEKWLGKKAPNEPMLGSADIQSLADLGGSYERLDRMRVVPFDRRTVMTFAVASALPMFPLLLTVMNVREIVTFVAKAML